MQRVFIGLSALLLFSASLSAQESGQQSAQHLKRTVTIEMNYLLYLPKDYEADDQATWPLMLFLHGAGERGDDLELVKKHGPPKLAGEKSFPFIVVSPQCPRGRWWDPHELTYLLDEMEEKYRVDKDRIYVTGLSMGGYGTWALAAHTPDRFAAILPICGGGDPRTARRFAHIPAWVFHGAKDTVVPLKQSEDMVEALKDRNGNVRLTVYPEAGHDSWTETYDNPEVYAWMLEQKR